MILPGMVFKMIKSKQVKIAISTASYGISDHITILQTTVLLLSVISFS